MTFKLIITQTEVDGRQSKIELENSEPLQNQSELLNFLQPLVGWTAHVKPTPVLDFEELRAAFKEEEPKPEPKVQPKEEPRPIVNRPKNPPPEKVEVRKVSERETGVVQIHCPKCGLETAKNVPIKNQFFPCPTCKTKLFMYPLNEVRGEPNELGVSFKANQVYLTVQERWEHKHGK